MTGIRKTILMALFVIMLCPALAHADYLTLRMTAREIGSHEFFYDLLYSALEQAGHLPVIEKVEDHPHLRIRDMLKHGEINVHWLIRSPERDKKYIPVPVPLTNGLIGQRILLIRPQDKEVYKDVKNLGDFRRLGKVGGFGAKWYDTHVWNYNHIPYREVAKPNLIYAMVAAGGRGIDYFSRGFNEVVDEARLHPELIIEPHIMFVYDRDFIFYVSPTQPELAPTLEDALIKARDSGLMGKLIRKHWAQNYDIIRPAKRSTIRLKTPE